MASAVASPASLLPHVWVDLECYELVPLISSMK